ncbi:unnamed protein product, partial [Owenia fusiformis]
DTPTEGYDNNVAIQENNVAKQDENNSPTLPDSGYQSADPLPNNKLPPINGVDPSLKKASPLPPIAAEQHIQSTNQETGKQTDATFHNKAVPYVEVKRKNSSDLAEVEHN